MKHKLTIICAALLTLQAFGEDKKADAKPEAAKAETKTEAAAKPPLSKEEKELWEKVSYAVGMNIGDMWKANQVDFDIDEVAAGLRDTMSGKPTKMTKEQQQDAIKAWQKKLAAEHEASAKIAVVENKKKGADFLAANAKKEGVKTTASGLQYKVIKNGDGKTPTDSDMVLAHYTGTLIDGKEFDSSRKSGQPAQFPVQGVIKGWTEALKMMKVGSKWMLFIPPDLAYGENPPTPSIPPNSTLIFEVELIEVKPAPDAQRQLPVGAKPSK